MFIQLYFNLILRVQEAVSPFWTEVEVRANGWLLCFSGLQIEPQYLLSVSGFLVTVLQTNVLIFRKTQTLCVLTCVVATRVKIPTLNYCCFDLIFICLNFYGNDHLP